ncbi:RNA demethylase ALKBH10B [Benincasa hispida]|uniref:RNA demethylase ALKBH10B n=1 Tax=Benincasa hispida TaxID=102211 RepID=UPI0018FF735B|nr:RNA demethylase ALKBH10B [Benincasa hispida]
MPMAAGATDRARPVVMPAAAAMTVTDTLAKDAVLGWFRGEFAAANAIIDALCGHLAQVSESGGSEYEAVFGAIHRRRLNWIPVLQMQKYHPIADVAVELRKVTTAKKKNNKIQEEEEVKGDEVEAVAVAEGDGGEIEMEVKKMSEEDEKEYVEEDEKEYVEEETNNGKLKIEDMSIEINETDGGRNEVLPPIEEEDSIGSEITDSGSQEGGVQANYAEVEICSNHEECEARPGQMKLTKGFSAKEPVKGHMVNVVKGLKCYEDVFTQSELARLNDFVDDLRSAGNNGELSGETFVLFNTQVKGSRREIIQFGVPIFRQIRNDSANNSQTSKNIEPIPPILVTVIDHLIQWQLIPEYKRPNGCLFNFFEEGEYSQPFQKPPHLEQPISTLFLSESTMAFGRSIVSDNEGNYKGPLMLSLKEGSLLVMRGNSADVARHVMCASPNKRVTITFFRVRPDYDQCQSPTPQMSNAMTLWQPGVAGACALPNGATYGYEAMEVMPKWGILRAPVVMLAPVRPMVMSPGRSQRDGTGVFLPWAVNTRKPAKHLPPRARKGRFLALPPAVETHLPDSSHEPGISV